jgi:hypothetical protein
VLVSGAATEVTVKALSYFMFGGGRIAVQNLLGNHEHSRSTEPALQSVLVPEGFLNAMKFAAALSQAFHSQNIRTVCLNREHRATLNRTAIHLDGTGSAERRFATDVGSGKPHYFPQVVDQKKARFNIMGVRFSVNSDGYWLSHR